MEKEKAIAPQTEEISRVKTLIQEKKLFQGKRLVKPTSCRPSRSVFRKKSIRPVAFVKGE